MSLNPTPTATTTENNTEQPTSRPSSAGSNHEDEQIRFERRLSNINDEENKQSNNIPT